MRLSEAGGEADVNPRRRDFRCVPKADILYPLATPTIARCCPLRCHTDMAILAELISDDVLDTAYDWLCKRRRNYPADADMWSFRQQWPVEKDRLKVELGSGRYRFGLLTRVTLKDGEEVDFWSARDALVLKVLTIMLAKHLPISTRCTHVKGHGGAKAAVRQVVRHLWK